MSSKSSRPNLVNSPTGHMLTGCRCHVMRRRGNAVTLGVECRHGISQSAPFRFLAALPVRKQGNDPRSRPCEFRVAKRQGAEPLPWAGLDKQQVSQAED